MKKGNNKPQQRLIWTMAKRENEQGGTAATNLQLASEQLAMQGLHCSKSQLMLPPPQPGKALHYHLCNSAAIPVNGQWRDCASQTSESVCPQNPLAAGCGECTPRNLFWQDSCRGVPRLHRGSAPNQSSLCCTTCGALCLCQTRPPTRDFQVLGAHACDNCKLLQHVDISNSSVEEIQEFAFELCALCQPPRGQTAVFIAHHAS